MRRDPRAEQRVRDDGGLGGGVPAVEIQRRIRFRDAHSLHLGQRVAERLPLLQCGQDVVRRRVHDAAEAGDVHAGQRLPREIEKRNPVHHRAFEQKTAIGKPRRFRQRVIGEGCRTFVRRDDVRAAR